MNELTLEHQVGNLDCEACRESGYDEPLECECGGIIHFENQTTEINYGGYYPMITDRIEEHYGITHECDRCGGAYFKHTDCHEDDLEIKEFNGKVDK